jgi:FAD:protein FMN transferase
VSRPHHFLSMGMIVEVAGASEEECARIESLFQERDCIFSRFRPDSELNRINAHAGRPVLVSPLFASMVELALAAFEQTGGLVDPSLGAALVSAGYDRDFDALRDDARPPGPAQGSARDRIALAGRLLAVPAGVELDLNGVVKSRTVDEALALVRAEGWVSAGGDLATRGPLTVGLPGGDAVRLLRGGLATSGSDRRHWRRGTDEQHHLLDPRTGRPARSSWLQVTACGASCTAADVAAKAAFLLGDDGPDWLDAYGLPGRFCNASGEVFTNASWERSLAEHACT